MCVHEKKLNISCRSTTSASSLSASVPSRPVRTARQHAAPRARHAVMSGWKICQPLWLLSTSGTKEGDPLDQVNLNFAIIAWVKDDGAQIGASKLLDCVIELLAELTRFVTLITTVYGGGAMLHRPHRDALQERQMLVWKVQDILSASLDGPTMSELVGSAAG